MEKTKVSVYITTIHKTEDESMPIEIKASGIYTKTDDYHYVDYEYFDVDSKSKTKTLVKASKNRVEVNTKGDSNYRLVFDKSEEHISKVQMGELITSFKQVTNKVSLEENSNGVIIFIDYELYRGRELMSSCEMLIKTEYDN